MKNAMQFVCCAAAALLAGAAGLQAQTLAANPASVSLTSIAGSATPATQAIAISSIPTTPPIYISVSILPSSAAAWLKAEPVTSPFTPISYQVTANAASLPAATYTATLEFSGAGALNKLSVPVTFTVAGAATSALTATPAALNFTHQTGAANPPLQTINIGTSGASQVTYTVLSSATWLLAGGTNVAPGTLTVTVNPAGLTPNTYTGKITLTPPGGTPLEIGVTLTVTSSPALNVSPGALTFYYQIGQAAPAAKSLTLSNSGTPIAFTAAAVTTSGGNWLVVDKTGGTTPSNLSLSVVPAALAALGPTTYTGTVVINALGASNQTQSIPVSLVVSQSPLLDLGATSLSFNYQVGGASPADQTVAMNTTSAIPLIYVVSASTNNTGNWLIATPVNGVTPNPITVSVVPAGLGAGTYTGTISITAPGAGNSPQTISVVLKVSNDALLAANPGSLVFNYQTGKAAPAIQSVAASSTGAALGFTVSTTMNNTSAGINWLLTSLTASATPATLNVAVIPSALGATLPPGTYTGSIVLTPAGGATAPVTIPVTLNVSDKPLVNANPAALAFTYQTGGTAPPAQALNLTSTGEDVLATVSFSTTTGGAWLPQYTVSVNVGSTVPFSLPVSVTPTNLSVGVYKGAVTITPQNGNPATTAPVTLTVTGGAIAASPDSLTFTQASGGAPPASKTLSISTSGATAMNFSVAANGVSGGVTWLSATPASGVAVGSTAVPITVSVNAGSLQPGTYNGSIAVISVGAANSPLNIPVTLTVGPAVTLTVPAAPMAFNYQIGNAVPAAQTLTVTTAGGPVQFTAQAATAAGTGNWLAVTPTTGTTPANLAVAVNTANLAPGSYTGTITIASAQASNSPQTVNVTLTVAAMPLPMPATVLNVASSLPGPLAPGEIISIYGTNLGPAVGVANTKTSGVVETTLGETQVLFDNIPGPVLYARADVVNVIVPYRVAGRADVNVQVVYKSATSSPLRFRVADAAPGISANAQGQAAVVHANGTYNSPANPAPKGSIVVFYGTGEGQTTPAGEDGRIIPLDGSILKKPVQEWKVTIGGVPAEVLYIGSSPSFVSGAFQANVRVPEDAPSGSAVPIVLTIGNTSSAGTANMAVR